MKYITYILSALLLASCETPFFSSPEKYETPFENKDGLKSSSYEEVIDYYKQLSQDFASISFKTMGQTDNGVPLHLVIYSPDAEFNFNKYRKERTIIFINNAVHGNEPDGVDATMLLFRNLAQNEIKLSGNVMVVTIPAYNIGGMQENRKESAAHYNLDNDFVKADVENTLSFAKIFQEVQPDIFIDNQVSRKEEYQYTLSYSFSDKQKLGSFLSGYIDNVLEPRFADPLLNRSDIFKKDTLHTFIDSQHGFKFYYLNQNPNADYTAQFGDIVTYDYSLSDLRGNELYQEKPDGDYKYNVDKEEVFQGLRSALKLLKEKESGVFFFPSSVAYGYRGDKDKITFNQPIIAKIEVFKIEKNKEKIEPRPE